MPSRVASWHHGSSVSVILTPMRDRKFSRPWSVIFGNSAVFSSRGMRRLLAGGRWRRELRFAQGLPVDLARRRLGQSGHERDVARVLVPAEPRARELLQLAGERLVAAARAHDERLHDLAAQSIRDADHGGLA